MKVVRTASLVVGLIVCACATTESVEQRRANAQAVADIDRMSSSSLNGLLTDEEQLRAEKLRLSEAWLRAELAALAQGNADADIARAQQIVHEAAARSLPTVAADAERLEGQRIEERYPEAQALVAKGQWLDALTLMTSLTAASRPTSSGGAVLRDTQGLVRTAIAKAHAEAQPRAERFLFERMRSWVDGSAPQGENAAAVNAVTNLSTTINWGSSGCNEAQKLAIASIETGTKVSVDVRLGACDVRVARASGVPRSSSYTVKVERMRPQEYTVTETRETKSYETKRECNQVTKNIATTGPKNYITVTECNTRQYEVPRTEEVEVIKTRMVPVIEDERRTEAYLAETLDATVGLTMSVTVNGDNQTVTVNDTAQVGDHDEQYSREHGPSRSFRSDVEGALRRGLSSPVQSLTNRAIREWNDRRASARLAQAKAATSVSEARAFAVEAVALNADLAAEAAPLLKLHLNGPAFAALMAGNARVPTRALPAGGLTLPDPSQSLAANYARLEERKTQVEAMSNRDMLLGVGAGLQPTPDAKATGAFALEVQIGYVPTFAAVSHLIARLEGDLQIFASSFAQADLAFRPEIGVRFGPFSLSALAAAGGRLGLTQVSLDVSDDGVFGARAYAGYGAHVALHVGPILLDAMALRLHQTANVAPLMTRADGLIGVGLSDAVFLMARARYQAQADLLRMFTVSDRFASLTLGIMLQF